MVQHFTVSLAALAFQSGGGTDWLSVFAQNLTSLTTQNGGVLTSFGMTELSFISLMVLVSMVIQWSTATMSFSFHHEPLRMGDMVSFMLRLICCLLAENYWSNPLPGGSFGFNHLFSYMAEMISRTFDQNALSNLQTLLKTLGEGTASPSITAPLELLAYILIQIVLAFSTAIHGDPVPHQRVRLHPLWCLGTLRSHLHPALHDQDVPGEVPQLHRCAP